MKVFDVTYQKYNETKGVTIAAATIQKALEKAQKIVRQKYADRVKSITELLSDVEVA